MISHKWQPIQSLEADCGGHDFAEIDSLQKQWIEVKEEAEDLEERAFEEFTERLLRSWAIETGIIEGLYTVSEGVTHTLIEKGLSAEYVEKTSTDKDPLELVEILKSHRSTIDFVYQWIREGQPLTKWFICAVHQAVTARQITYQAVSQFGDRFETELHRGEFRKYPNNPTRPDGALHEYCPPEQVESELDNLIFWYESRREAGAHPLLMAAWLHHRFTQIHPFEDGNGRVARALLTWHLVREDFLPIVIHRDIRSQYIDALEGADLGSMATLVELMVRLEKDTIMQALKAGEPEPALAQEANLVAQVIDHIADRVARRRRATAERMRRVNDVALNLRDRGERSLDRLAQEASVGLREKAGISVSPYVESGGPDSANEHWYRHQISRAADESGYWANLTERKYFVKLTLNPSPGSRTPRLVLVISLHHVGRQLTGIMVAAPFVEIEHSSREYNPYDAPQAGTPELFSGLGVSPFTFTCQDSAEALTPRFSKWAEQCFSVALRTWGEYLDAAS